MSPFANPPKLIKSASPASTCSFTLKSMHASIDPFHKFYTFYGWTSVHYYVLVSNNHTLWLSFGPWSFCEYSSSTELYKVVSRSAYYLASSPPRITIVYLSIQKALWPLAFSGHLPPYLGSTILVSTLPLNFLFKPFLLSFVSSSITLNSYISSKRHSRFWWSRMVPPNKKQDLDEGL